MRIKGLLVIGALTLSALAAPMTAEAGISQCLSNKMCVWGNNDFEWLLTAQIHGQSSWLDTFNNGAGENNQNDSWANRSATYTGCLADYQDGGGKRMEMKAASSDSDLAWFNSNFADAIRTKGGC